MLDDTILASDLKFELGFVGELVETGDFFLVGLFLG